MKTRMVVKIGEEEIKALENKIDDLIEKANHISDYKEWQKLSAQIASYREDLKLMKAFI